MSTAPPPVPRSDARLARKLIGTALGIGMVAFGTTTLFLSMRAVMDIGGSCASGGPFEVANPCPGGVGWLTPVSLFIAVIGAGIYIASVFDGGPDLTALFWSGLFVPLGWNFFEYGFAPPGRPGIEWSWVVCGIVFWLMGGLPLFAILKPQHLKRLVWGGTPYGAGKKQKARRLAPILPERYRTNRPPKPKAPSKPQRPPFR